MCVVVCKAPGVAFPKMKRLETCWENNPQGAGVAWWDAKAGNVRIEKGLMTWDSFEMFVKKLHKTITAKNTAVMYHFRIASKGETVAAQCHPYPMSASPADLNALSTRTRVAVAHNGTMPIGCYKDMNDTQTFIIDYLMSISRMCTRFWENKDALALIERVTESKMAFMAGNAIYTLGKFIKADDGCLYSNSGYEEYDYGALDDCWNKGYWKDGVYVAYASTTADPEWWKQYYDKQGRAKSAGVIDKYDYYGMTDSELYAAVVEEGEKATRALLDEVPFALDDILADAVSIRVYEEDCDQRLVHAWAELEVML